jgi:proteasome lid subunit RPN8/RPN11
MLRPSERRFLLEWAAKAAPLEACGFITASGYAIPISNLAEERNRFVMAEAEVLDAHRVHGDFLAVWHSHPEGQEHPSSLDCQHHPDGLPMIIVAGQSIWEWDLSKGYPMRVGQL